jgi:hypothetical protein
MKKLQLYIYQEVNVHYDIIRTKTGGWSRQRRREGKRQPDISVKGLATVLVHGANPNQVIL